jgi:ribose 5-phosphate isomerase B
MRIVIGADHAGYSMKEDLRAMLEQLGHSVRDVGTASLESVDYPDFAHQVADAVSSGDVQRGVLVCGTGVGVAITANRHAGVRAVNATDAFTVRMARAHNDANVLALGSRVVGSGLARDLVEVFLTTKFEGGRHVARVAKIEPPS